MSKKQVIILGICSVVFICLVAALMQLFGSNSEEPTPEKSTLVDQRTLSNLPKKSASGINTTHLAPGLIPPTNKWFSGLALQEESKPVFPSPISFKANDNGYEIGLPKVQASDKLLLAPHQPTVTATIRGADNYKVSRYDELSLDIMYFAGTSEVGYATVTAGSPLVFFTAVTDDVIISFSNVISSGDSSLNHKSGGTSGATHYFDGMKIADSDNNFSLTAQKDSFLSTYLLPEGAADVLKPVAGNKVKGTNVSFSNTGTESTTKLSINTDNDQSTIMSFLPHQNIDAEKKNLVFQTLYGPATTHIGQDFSYSVRINEVKKSLNLSDLSDSERDLLITTLRRDVNATNLDLGDSYFGGKSAYRASQLLVLANQLGQNQIEESIKLKLRNYLGEWLTGSAATKQKSFYYDPDVKGVVGEQTAFGSEQFNDHHFHYGYFIYAAAILAEEDQEFLKEHRGMVDLLVADIANYGTGEDLPLRRAYDPYFGHSWASGFAPFNDGNNQESVSEAINAWAATYLWGEVTNNTQLKDQSQWMLSNEVDSANQYWLNFNKQEVPYVPGYNKNIISLNWGGKREYATFFSAEPSAMLGIQLIPMNPTLKDGFMRTRIEQNVSESGVNQDMTKQFSDYILMYSAISSNSSTDDLLAKAQDLPDEVIDGANSRAYVYAWLLSSSK